MFTNFVSQLNKSTLEFLVVFIVSIFSTFCLWSTKKRQQNRSKEQVQTACTASSAATTLEQKESTAFVICHS